MRFIMRISWDVEAGNAIIRAGKLGQIVQSIDHHDAAALAALGSERMA